LHKLPRIDAAAACRQVGNLFRINALPQNAKQLHSIRKSVLALQHISRFEPASDPAMLFRHDEGVHDVDIALKLNFLAVCAVFVFVGALLLGAF
jgi:hypothetical protein